MFRIATAAYSCCPLCSDSSRSCASCLLTAPMQAPSSTTVPAQRCAVWWSRLSNALMAPRALSSNPSVGSLSAPLPGSTAAGGSPRTGKTATTTHSPSSASPPSASCSDGSVILHEVFGRTFRQGAFAGSGACDSHRPLPRGTIQMCGIVGVISSRQVAPLILDSLRRLEYRGYDSAGIATLVDDQIQRRRVEGKLGNLAAE